MKRFFALLLVVVMVLSLFAACGKEPAGNDATTAAGDTTTAAAGDETTAGTDEPTEPEGEKVRQVNNEFYPMTGIEETFDVIYYGEGVEDAVVYQEMIPAIGVKINPIEYKEEQYQMVMRSGNLPDACYQNYGFDKTQLFEMGEAGLLVNLADYMHIMPNFAEYLDTYPNARLACTNEDGSIYAFPSVIETAGSQSNLIYVRADMAEAAGWTEMPTTVEGLMEMALDIQETFSDIDGFNAISWWAGEYLKANAVVCDTLFPAFGELVSAGFTANSNNEVILGASTEQYKNYLKYMAEAYSSGAVWKEVYSDDGTMAKAKLAADEIAISFGNMTGVTKEHFASNTFEVLVLDPLTSEIYTTKHYAKVPAGNVSSNSWISAKCKDIETMCRWFDAFFAPEDNPLNDEGTLWRVSAWLGEKGKDFVVIEETEFGKGYDQPNGSPAGAMGYPFMGSTTYYSAADTLFGIKCDAMINKMLPYADYRPAVINQPLVIDDQIEYDNAWIDMEKYINESSAKFITGQWDVDTMWDSYTATLDDMGESYVCEILQPYWDEYISK